MAMIGVIDINPTRARTVNPRCGKCSRVYFARDVCICAAYMWGRLEKEKIKKKKKKERERESRFLSRRTSGRLIFVISRFEIWAQP